MRYAVHLALSLALLCGCAVSPAPQFFGATRQEVALEGYRFTVFVKTGRAEVVRRGYLPRAARDRVPALMVRAAEIASGCTVIGPAGGIWRAPSLPGDTGEARFELAC
ncbi:hypothetical protein [Rhodobacter lacus]|uniref:Lipoprotein n=1 Tax=Rhodobacter lacus TaxID=1641972 RepID=A0ABW5AAY2_9RHOB